MMMAIKTLYLMYSWQFMNISWKINLG